MTEDIDNLYAMLSEYNLVGDSKERWIDSSAIRHVYSNKEFIFYFLYLIRTWEDYFYGNFCNNKDKRNWQDMLEDVCIY